MQSTTDSAFGINNSGVVAALSEFTQMTGGSSSVVKEVETLVVDALVFATIGSAVGSASTTLHSQLVSGLTKVVSFIETLGGTVQTVLKDYQLLDQEVAQAFKALGLGGPAAATPAAPAAHPATQAPATQTPATQTPAAHTPATPAQHPATPAPGTAAHPTTQPVISGRVVDSIMASEGAHGEQGGVDEVYGFRQSSHNGYDQIMAARAQYGQGSPEERAVVANLLTQHADQAGAQNFTDPGIRAAIASEAHLRGPGGTRAILNSMVTGDVTRSANSVSADNVAALQQLTPDQFQQQFHDARINYDQTVYGNTITHQGGHTDTWWNRYGNGLTQRYDREQQLFDSISQQGN